MPNPKRHTLDATPPFIFFGTSQFAVYILDELQNASMTPSLVVTAPDRRAGRGMRLTPPPVKVWAEKNEVEHTQPEILDSVLISTLNAKRLTLAIVASYGQIIPRQIINMFPKGMLNVHPSLLPKYRGPSPVQSQILADDRNVGVSIMLLDNKVDHGPLVASYKLQVSSYQNEWPMSGVKLEELLAREGGKLLVTTIPDWLDDNIEAEEQNHQQATFTRKITKQDGLIYESDIVDKPYQTYLKIRAYDPWPGVYFFRESNNKPKEGQTLQRVTAPMRIKIKSAVYNNGRLEKITIIPEGGGETDYSPPTPR